jgi:hypothetical protein
MWQDFSPSNPFRVPDWRRARVRTIVEGTLRYSRRKDDVWVKRAWKFYEAMEACENSLDYGGLSERYPDLYWAHEMNTSSDEGTEFMRWEIEARLLANQPFDQVAERTGCTEATIVAYHELYFCVRPKLSATSYIVHKVIGPSVHRGLTSNEPDVLWKLYGYFGGSYVINAVVDKFTSPAKAQRDEDVPAFVEDSTLGNIKRSAMIASHTMPINSFTQAQILEQWMKLREIEASSEAAQQGQATILSNLEACFQVMPFSVGKKSADVVREQDQLAEYTSMGVELRCDELLRVSAGETLPHKRLLENMPYPDAPGATDDLATEDKS